jgi:hypothetical protein
MKIVDFDGTVLDATFSVQPPDEGVVSVVFESSGGRAGGPNPRNLQYRQGLNVLLRRLQLMNAVLAEIRVETERTRALPVDHQRIEIGGRPFPIALAGLGDIENFRKEISRYGRKIGQSAETAAAGGGSSRRLRFFLTGISEEQAVLERELGGTGVEADADVVGAVVQIAAGNSSHRGQGFLVSQAVRNAVERHAVDWARDHYRHGGWVVTDVGATSSYDLHCTQGHDELRVEVKGTTTAGESVILTRNEVTHAGEAFPHVELFVVSEIAIETNSERPGCVRRRRPSEASVGDRARAPDRSWIRLRNRHF